MNTREFLSNVSAALIAQLVSLFVSCIATLLVPKLLGVEEYGYWQLFIFYSSYAGVFHLGLNDGVYLIKGGQRESEIDKPGVSSQLKISLLYECFIAALVVVAAFAVDSDSRRYVLIAFAVYIVVYNVAAYYGLVFQAMNQTKRYSFSVMVSKVLYLACLVSLLVAGCTDFELYVLAYIVTQCASLAYCVIKAPWIISGAWLGFGQAFLLVKESIKVGIKLMVANTAGALILGIMRFAMDQNWGIESFGQLSLAISLSNFFLLFVSQVAMVLFPALRQCDEAETRQWFVRFQKGLTIVLPMVFVLYLPIRYIVGLWLPSYQVALDYLILLLPICVFDGKMNLLCTTFLKVFRLETELLFINLLTVLTTGVAIGVAVFVGASPEAIIVISVVAVALRSVCSEIYLSCKQGIELTFDVVYSVLISAVFIMAFYYFSLLSAFLIVLTSYIVLLTLHRRELCDIAVLIRKKKE